jgi:hypothetical protein
MGHLVHIYSEFCLSFLHTQFVLISNNFVFVFVRVFFGCCGCLCVWTDKKICITAKTSAAIEHLDPWISYHRSMGMDFFFLFVEGQAASAHTRATLGTFHVIFFCAGLSLDPPHPTSLSLSVP